LNFLKLKKSETRKQKKKKRKQTKKNKQKIKNWKRAGPMPDQDVRGLGASSRAPNA
jgi:hypothetical protein